MKACQLLFGVAAILSTATGLRAEEGISTNSRIELALADYAKLLCSAVFVSHRDLEEAKRNSGPLVTENFGSSYSALSEADRTSNTKVVIDDRRKLVRVSLRELGPRTARFYGDQGCVILPKGVDKAFFTPAKVRSQLPNHRRELWPMGDTLTRQLLPAEIDSAKLNAAVDLAFSDPQAKTVAFLVIYKGQILAERYSLGVNEKLSWMGHRWARACWRLLWAF